MDSTIPARYEHVKTTLNSTVISYMEKFALIWEECGYNDTSIQQRCDAVMKHFQSLFDEMLEEEEGNKNIIIRKIEQYLKETAELSKDLGVQIIVTGYENLPLCNVEQTLRYKVQEYRRVKESRMNTLAELQNREKLLCNILGIQPLEDFTNQVPTEQQLEEFEIYINEKNEEKERLVQMFQETKSAIITLMTDLEVTPTLEFEKRVVCEEDSAFRVTKENMTALRQLHLRLERQLDETKAEATELREKLTQLWDRLHEEYRHRDEFLVAHRGHSSNTLKALKDELKRCEELKRQNIKRFVGEIRSELKHWWDRCLVSEEQRLHFLPFASDCFTEDLLELHELEVQKYRSYYQENVGIFELARQRQELWDKMLELEERANDPDRLFRNRGGQLLFEEKERKNIQKELPKVEKELLKYIVSYEEEHNQPFMFHGERVEDIIKNQWTVHRGHKEEQKKAKKVARDRLLEVESKLGSQLKGSKRKILQGVTPFQSSNKLRKVGGNDGTGVTENHHGTVQRTQVSRNIFAEVGTNSDSSSATNLTTYTDFQDHLEVLNQEGTCRSSVVPGRCLRERNTPARTPSKIPSKLLLPSALKNTPQSRVTPMKPPRKNILAGQHSSTKTPRTISRANRGTPNSPLYQRGITTPRLTTPRGRLPIII